MKKFTDLPPLKFLDIKYSFEFDKLELYKNFNDFYLRTISQISEKLLSYEYDLAFENNIVFDKTGFDSLKNTNEYKNYIFSKYPHFKNLLNSVKKNLTANFKDLLSNLNLDYVDLIDNKFIKPSSVVSNIQFGTGDFHSNLKSTCIIHFKNGCKVVYKPRKINTEIFFTDFISMLEKVCDEKIDIRLPNYLMKRKYSWHEFITYSFEDFDKNKQRYLSNIGKLLGIGYLLNSRDFIHDNIILKDHNLYLIDIECIISPNLETKGSLLSKISKQYHDSVINCGILPIPHDIFNKDKSISSLFAEEGSDNHHLPVKNGKVIEIAYKDISYVQRAFRQFLQKVILKKEFIIHYLQKLELKGTYLRLLYNTTDFYSKLLEEMTIPEYLHKIKDFENLILSSFEKQTLNFKKSIFKQLTNFDFPYFYTDVEGNIYDGLNTIVRKEKPTSLKACLAKISQKIERLDDHIISFNESIIRKSIEIDLDKKGKINYEGQNYVQIRNSDKIANLESELLLKSSETLAEQIIDESYQKSNEINWISKTLNSATGVFELSPLKPGIYDGTSGIELYLHYISKFSKNKFIQEAASKIHMTNNLLFDRAMKKSAKFQSNFSLSVFNFPFVVLLNSLHRSNSHLLEEQLEDTLKIIKENVKMKDDVDFLQGISSTLDKLLDLKHSGVISNKNLTVELDTTIELLVSKLFETAQEFENGIAWNFKMEIGGKDFDNFLAGYSHGVSGIMPVLSKAKHLLHNDKLNTLIDKAHNFEKNLFEKNTNSWLDNRLNDKTSDMKVWCHGSGGIGLSKLLMLHFENSKTYESELRTACDNLKDVENLNQSLCHGSMSNLEILRACDNYFRESKYKNLIDSYLEQMATQIIEGKQPKASELGALNLTGMFVGKTGIAYQLLRFYDWKKIPSIICLETPLFLYKTLH